MRRPHLLLVDDELHILKAAEFKFQRQGYQVQCARDGQEAWDNMLMNTPDLIVTDLQMPRMNGLELLKRIRADIRFHQLPAILLTAKGYELDHDEFVSRLDIFEIVSKPFSPRDLCKRVEMALAQTTPFQPRKEATSDLPASCLATCQADDRNASTIPRIGAGETTGDQETAGDHEAAGTGDTRGGEGATR